MFYTIHSLGDVSLQINLIVCYGLSNEVFYDSFSIGISWPLTLLACVAHQSLVVLDDHVTNLVSA